MPRLKRLGPPAKYPDGPDWPDHHDGVARRLVNAAWNALRTHDASALSVRELAAEVGVSAPNAYNHFRDRNALFGEVAAASLQMLLDELAAGDACRSWIAFARKRPRHFALAFSLEFADAAAFPQIAQLRARLREVFGALAEEQLGSEPSRDQARCFQALVHGAAALAAAGEQAPSSEAVLATFRKAHR